MKEKTARQRGYEFSGAYSHDKEEIKEEAKKERKKGNKAVMVEIKGQRNDGYAVYVIKSDENIKIVKRDRLTNSINRKRAEIAKKMEEIEEMERIIIIDQETLREL